MKTFKVEVWDEQGGYYFIEATDEAQAKARAKERLYNSVEMDKVTHGHREVLSIEVIKK